jgi:tetratricopeptide (TPR) repeat protein
MRLLIMVASLLLAVVRPAFADAASEYQAGSDAYNQNNYAEAIRHLTNAIRLKPDFAKAYVTRGNAYDDSGQTDIALADYSKAIVLSPGYADAYSNRGVAYYRKKEYDRALADLDKAIQLNPNFAFNYVSRGNVYDDKGLTDQALADYSSAIKVDPAFHRSYGERGSTYLRLGQLDKAMADLDKAIELNPRYAFAYVRRGQLREKKNDPDNAISDYRKALALDPARTVPGKACSGSASNPEQYEATHLLRASRARASPDCCHPVGRPASWRAPQARPVHGSLPLEPGPGGCSNPFCPCRLPATAGRR